MVIVSVATLSDCVVICCACIATELIVFAVALRILASALGVAVGVGAICSMPDSVAAARLPLSAMVAGLVR